MNPLGHRMRRTLKIRDSRSKKIAIRRNLRSLRSKKKRQAFRSGRPFGTNRGTSRLDVPRAIHIGSELNHKHFCRFMSELRLRMLGRKDRIILSFENTDIIIPPAMILFVAEIDRAKRILGDKFDVKIANVKNKTIKHLLVHIGLYDLCGMVPPKLNKTNFEENVRHWKYATGERANEDTNDAFAAIEGLISDKLRGGMWRGVSEAVINSVQHAYVEPRGVPGPRMKHRRWWMFTQEREGYLTVVVCDLGIGIPRSLPLNWDESVISSILSTIGEGGTDVAALKASLQLGRSSTGQSHRGKGLPQIWAAVRDGTPGQDASISIYSNKGRLEWSGKEDKEHAVQFPSSILGTVISWRVPIHTESPT